MNASAYPRPTLTSISGYSWAFPFPPSPHKGATRHDETPADAEDETRNQTDPETCPQAEGRQKREVLTVAAPDYQWATDPDLIVAAIKWLAGAVISLGAILVTGVKWVVSTTAGRFEKRMDSFESKADRIVSSLESLTVTTSTEIASIKATCKANHLH